MNNIHKILSTILIIAVIVMLLPMNISAEAELPVEVSVSGSSVFVEEEEISFRFTYYATGIETGTAQISSVVKNSVGSVCSAAETFDMSLSKNKIVKSRSFGKLPYGKYCVETTIETVSGSYTSMYDFCVTAFGANAEGNSNIGINVHFSHASTPHKLSDLELMKKAGITMIRDECPWDEIEKEQGVYTIPKRVYDYVNEADRLGMDVLLELNRSNTLYSDSIYSMPTSKEGIEAYAAFCGHIAKEFGDKIKYYEIWNEPDQETDNGNTILMPIKVYRYNNLVKAAAPAIRNADADKDSYIVVGSAASIIDSGSDEVRLNTTFIEGVCDSVGNLVDAISIHPYPYLSANIVDEFDCNYTKMMDAVKSVTGDLDIWITESGYASADRTRAVENRTLKMDDVKQAAYDTRTQILFQADARATKFFKYDMKDDGTNPEKFDDNFGIIDYEGQLKEGYYMSSALNSILSGTESCNESIVNMDDEYNGYSIYCFRSNDKEVYVLWANGDKKYKLEVNQGSSFKAEEKEGNLTLSLPTPDAAFKVGKEMKVLDSYGCVIEDETSVTLDYKPMYIMYSLKPDCNMSLENGIVTINGVSASPNDRITCIARDAISDKLIYVDQTRADSYRRYKIDFSPGDSESYMVYVGNSTIYAKQFNRANITIMQNGEVITDAAQLTEGEVTVKAKFSNPDTDKLWLYAAQYSDKLISANSTKLDEKGNAEMNLVLKDSGDGKYKLRFFFWDEDIMPYSQAIDFMEK